MAAQSSCAKARFHADSACFQRMLENPRRRKFHSRPAGEVVFPAAQGICHRPQSGAPSSSPEPAYTRGPDFPSRYLSDKMIFVRENCRGGVFCIQLARAYCAATKKSSLRANALSPKDDPRKEGGMHAQDRCADGTCCSGPCGRSSGAGQK